MQKLIHKFTLFLVSQGIVKEEDMDLYQYGFWSGFLYVVNITISLCILLFMGTVGYGIVFLILFFLFRSYAGGYHHRSPFVCFLLSQVSLILDMLLFKLLAGFLQAGNWMAMVIPYVCSCIIIAGFAPRQAPENPLSPLEVKRCRTIVAVLTVITMAAAFLPVWWQNYQVLSLMLVLNGTILVSNAAHFIKSIKARRALC